ncbi:MAG TPA: hypothetical protein VGV59_01650 [Pyrinomonadaceae bacterium]|nr:hypothetical protein [Pyrinomonadaceae bacterium]
MSTHEEKRRSHERLERFGSELVRASASNEEEAERAAASPFLYTRLRARIAAERTRRAEGERRLVLLVVLRRAIPALALVAAFAFMLSLFGAGSASKTIGVLSDEALLDARDAGVERVVFADRRSLSSDEVLATILNEEGREAQR